MLCWPGLVGQGTEPGQGAATPGPAPGKHFRGKGMCTWGIPEQQLPAAQVVSPAPPGQGKRWLGLACSGGDSWGSPEAGSGGSCLLCFLLLQPSCPWRKTPIPRSAVWQLRPSSSCQMRCQQHDGACGRCAAAEPWRDEVVLSNTAAFEYFFLFY